MPDTEKLFNTSRRRMGMVPKPTLQLAYTYNRKPTVIDAEPAGLAFAVELHEAGEVRVLARAENAALVWAMILSRSRSGRPDGRELA
jgi:hypothetical protein